MERTFVDRLSFPTEFRNLKELKTSIILLFITCLAFFLLSSAAIIFHLFIFSKTLLAGTLAYEFILFYLLDRYTRDFIEKKVNGKKVKRTLGFTSSIIFATLITLTFLTLIYTMLTPAPESENRFLSLSGALLLIVSPTFFWDELIHHFKKKVLKKFKIVGALAILLLLASSASAQNATNASLLSSLQGTISTVENGVNMINQVKNFISNFQTNLGDALNLTPQQTQVVTIVGMLIGVFLLLKFLSVIVKWVIIILIVWIIIQLLIG